MREGKEGGRGMIYKEGGKEERGREAGKMGRISKLVKLQLIRLNCKHIHTLGFVDEPHATFNCNK